MKLLVFINPTTFQNLISNYHFIKRRINENEDPIIIFDTNNYCLINSNPFCLNYSFDNALENFDWNIAIIDDNFNFDNIKTLIDNTDFKILRHSRTNGSTIDELEKLTNFCGLIEQPEEQNYQGVETLYNKIAQGITSSNLEFDVIWNAIPNFDKKKAERELISSKAKNKNLTLEDVNTESYKPYVRDFLEEVKSLDIFGTDFTRKLDYLLKTLEQLS